MGPNLFFLPFKFFSRTPSFFSCYIVFKYFKTPKVVFIQKLMKRRGLLKKPIKSASFRRSDQIFDQVKNFMKTLLKA